MNTASPVLHRNFSRAMSGARVRAGALAALLALLVGGVIAAVLSVRRTAARYGRRARADAACPPRLYRLRGAIVGVDKQSIAAALGRPHATIGRGDYHRDDTWYYPLDPARRLALAIEFDDGIARDTKVLRGPRPASTMRSES